MALFSGEPVTGLKEKEETTLYSFVRLKIPSAGEEELIEGRG